MDGWKEQGKGQVGYYVTSWKKELLDALAAKGDDDASLAETVEKPDERDGLSANPRPSTNKRPGLGSSLQVPRSTPANGNGMMNR